MILKGGIYMNRFKRSEPKLPPQQPKENPKDLVTDKEEFDLIIDDSNLNKELMDQSLLMRKYTRLASEANKIAKIKKLMREEKESELQLKFSMDGTGKRVKEVEASISLDSEVKKLKRDEIDAEELAEKFNGMVKSVHQRHEMLKDLCANKRKDLVD